MKSSGAKLSTDPKRPNDCIIGDKEPEPSGWEGLADVRIIEALYHSAETWRAVTIPAIEKTKRRTLRQEIRVSAPQR